MANFETWLIFLGKLNHWKNLLNFKNCDIYLKALKSIWKTTVEELIYWCSKSSALNVTRNKYHHRFFKKFVYVLGRASLMNTTDWCFRNFKDQIVEFTTKFWQIYFLWSKKHFLQNEYMFKKLRIYFACNTNILCIKIYFSNEIHIFYIFIYIFLCKKSFFQ